MNHSKKVQNVLKYYVGKKRTLPEAKLDNINADKEKKTIYTHNLHELSIN